VPSGVACSFSSVAVAHVATSWQCRRFLGAAASAFFVLLDTRLCITHSRPCITLSLLGRSSVATWLIRTVLNRARTRAGREGRLVGLRAWLNATVPGGGAVDVTGVPAGRPLEQAPRLWDELDPERIVGDRQL
jgi:hypothetical protein